MGSAEYRNSIHLFQYSSVIEGVAVSYYGKVIHRAGKGAVPGGGHTSHFSVAAIAGAWNRLGVVMTVADYRQTFPEWVAK